jgi:hypothetical protein
MEDNYGYNYQRGLYLHDNQTVPNNTNRVGSGNKIVDQKILDNMRTAHNERENFTPDSQPQQQMQQSTQQSFPFDMSNLKIMGIVLVMILLYLIFTVNSLQRDIQSLMMINQMNSIARSKT